MKVLEAAKEKWHITNRGQTLQNDRISVQKQWRAEKKWDTFQGLKENNCGPIVLYLIKIYFRNVDEIQTFSGEGRLGEFIANRSTLEKKDS